MSEGVWVTWFFDNGSHVVGIYPDEMDAYRAAEEWQKVAFVEFGEDVSALWKRDK
jgi:hypothetical protein